jgi:uncharacterized protein (DUF2147 family)
MTPLRHRIIGATLALIGAGAALAPAAAQPAAPSIYGVWLNPHKSVAVRTGPCADRLCGWIVWANAEAQSDARDGGVDRLVGTALLENYRPDGTNSWSGTVFVPDMGKRFYSEIEQIDANDMKVKGCILHGLICKSQIWHRIADVPHE